MNLEFTIFSPLTPVDWIVVFALIAVLCIYWLAKAISSIATGAGGN